VLPEYKLCGQYWLSNGSNYVVARATQRIGDRFGFYIHGNHPHCGTLPAESPVFTSTLIPLTPLTTGTRCRCLQLRILLSNHKLLAVVRLVGNQQSGIPGQLEYRRNGAYVAGRSSWAWSSQSSRSSGTTWFSGIRTDQLWRHRCGRQRVDAGRQTSGIDGVSGKRGEHNSRHRMSRWQFLYPHHSAPEPELFHPGGNQQLGSIK